MTSGPSGQLFGKTADDCSSSGIGNFVGGSRSQTRDNSNTLLLYISRGIFRRRVPSLIHQSRIEFAFFSIIVQSPLNKGQRLTKSHFIQLLLPNEFCTFEIVSCGNFFLRLRSRPLAVAGPSDEEKFGAKKFVASESDSGNTLSHRRPIL